MRTLIVMIMSLLVIFGCAKRPTKDSSPKEDTMEETRKQNRETVKRFLALLEQEDIDQWINLWAEQGKQINPYASGLFPDVIAGKKALYEHWKNIPGQFNGMKYPITEIFPMLDPNLVAVEFKGQIKLKNGGEYNNDYFCLFRFDQEGNIVEYTEYFNPITVVRSFGLKDKV